tara:strand:- start:1072 stop:1602 length:531 start_codon:yes stop_codon:yes gene_type:complete
VNFKKLDTFIHEYDFPIHDLIIPYKEDIIKQFESKLNFNKGNNIPYTNSYLEDLVFPKFLDLIKNNYEVDNLINDLKLWVYVQNNFFNRPSLHHHIPTSTLNAVFYINIPKIGGELEFKYEDTSYVLSPKKDKIYIFPYWLPHKPLPQKDEDKRICFNLEYFCKQRPMHKETQIIW